MPVLNIHHNLIKYIYVVMKNEVVSDFKVYLIFLNNRW